METIGAAVGILAVLPQCVEAAKTLYELRTSFDEAPMLITSIYSESMVIEASLSQIRNLLQRGALQNKPELYEPFDRALTGCMIVYSCLEQSVRELAEKTYTDTLRSRDRLKYLWKEDKFKELLQQIRGQQIGLGLLVQGLQMESMADITQLLQDNLPRLEEATLGSRDLRLSHPNIKVPDSIFDLHSDPQSVSDAQSILSSAEFAFDDEVINSKAYRRVMAQATLRSEKAERTTEVIEGDLIDLNAPIAHEALEAPISGAALELQSLDLHVDHIANQEKDIVTSDSQTQEDDRLEHSDLLRSLEENLLPFMPPSTPAYSRTGPQSASSVDDESSKTSADETGWAKRDPELQKTTSSAQCDRKAKALSPVDMEATHNEESPPPLPPRRPNTVPAPYEEPTRLKSDSAVRPVASDEENSILSTPSLLSKISTLSSQSSSGKDAELTAIALQHTSSFELFEALSFNVDDLARVATLEDVEMHNKWAQLITDEEKFIERTLEFRRTFRDAAVEKWPILEKHLEAIVLAEQLANQHRQYLLDPLKSQIVQKSFATCNPALFEAWATKTHQGY